MRFEWEALDSWLEEDEPVFVHPRSPYSRVDALRSGSSVRVELDGAVLAEATDCVKLFETGRPATTSTARPSTGHGCGTRTR